MSPKEKAQELVDKFMTHVYCYMGSGMLSNTYDEEVAKSNAKQCALICVDEIINATPHSPSEIFELMPHFVAGKYWQQVKQEIQNL